MWRYYFNSRWSTDNYIKRLTIAALKKFGFLEGGRNWYHATVTWSNNSNIWMQVEITESTGTVRVYFSQKEGTTWESKNFDYKISLVSTPCNYGWRRWWFLCPIKWNKCSILYLQNNGLFWSRKTLNLCYEDQKKSHKYRNFSFMMGMNAVRAIALERTIKYPYRNGKPTKKMVRFMRLSQNNPFLEEIENFEFFGRKASKK